MILRPIASLAAATGLAFAPLASDAQILLLPACGGGTHLLVIPGAPGKPGDHPCSKPCHAVTERRSKPTDDKKGCC